MRPLYPEVKQYIEDLLSQNSITESKSPYSSPVVCVREKDGTLRLFIDYRELNHRTMSDRHPIPRVHFHTWLSVLDQGIKGIPPGVHEQRKYGGNSVCYIIGAI